MAAATLVYGDPATLYARCGGIFGVSSFASRCMDLWMAEPKLNANAAVARWHASAQRPGFKFLVVQIVCSLTGGPQVYTGRAMDLAHKHLNISLSEWEVFMAIFNDVCAEFGLPASDIDDLNALMISMMDECVVWEGEQPRPDPGPFRPGGNSIYARVGGVYQIALFADRLVDALLSDDRVAVPVDGSKRNEGSLKYLVTEVLCKVSGGPEVITCPEAQETWLLVPRAAWPIVTLTAKLAADHIEDPGPRDAFLALIEREKARFIDPHSDDGVLPTGAAARRAAAVKTKQQASWEGADKLLTRAVISARHASVGASAAARKRVYGDPRTLYGRGGGVFGLARLSHYLMEEWMADAKLNANERVATWHDNDKRAGFKFLVTQIMGYMAGGPQRYTGRSMEESHMHLAISPGEWRQFMTIADSTFEKLSLPVGARRELRDIWSGFESQCVLPPGLPAPPNPGHKPHPATVGTAYHRLGGVYPLASFVDRLVDELASEKAATIGVELDDINDPLAQRHAPGLKYLLTELFCSKAGGTEVVTASGFDGAKLGVPAAGWASFCALATEVAAVVFPTQHHRAMATAIVADLRDEICIGVTHIDSPVDKITAVGFPRFDAIGALAQCGGHSAERAIELLLTGWRPEGAEDAEASTQDGAQTGTAEGAPKCPFGFSAASGSGRPTAAPSLPPALAETVKVMAERGGQSAEQIAQMLQLDLAAVNGVLAPPEPEPELVPSLPPGVAEAAITMSERGLQAEQIATMLACDVVAVQATINPTAGQGTPAMYKALGDPMQQRLDQLLDEDPDLCCPVTLVLFADPVTLKDGFTYERAAAQALIAEGGGKFVSPMTRGEHPAEVEANTEMQQRASKYRRDRAADMLQFAEEASQTNPEMAMSVVDRVAEYLSAMPPEAIALLAQQTLRSCEAMLKTARTADNVKGIWQPKPQQIRRLNALKMQVTAGGGADLRQLTCLVCFDEYPALKGTECERAKGDKHFLCEECFAGTVQENVSAGSIAIFTRVGGIRCVDPDCDAPVFSDATLAKSLPEALFGEYTVAKERVAEQRINSELEAGFEQRLQLERAKAGGDAAREMVKQHICERILTLACPRCGQAFVDFNGCMALTCSRAGCGCGFCAICQEDCGGDAHPHIGAGCKWAKRCGIKPKEFHVSAHDWPRLSSASKVIRLNEYLETLTEARKQYALEDCARELGDLGIDPALVGKAESAGKASGKRRGKR